MVGSGKKKLRIRLELIDMLLSGEHSFGSEKCCSAQAGSGFVFLEDSNPVPHQTLV